LLRRVRDYAEVKGRGTITQDIANRALAMLDVDPQGFDLMDRKLLEAVIHRFDGGPVGLDNIAASIGEEPGTIEDVIEPYLIQQGYLQRTPRGAYTRPTASGRHAAASRWGFVRRRDAAMSRRRLALWLLGLGVLLGVLAVAASLWLRGPQVDVIEVRRAPLVRTLQFSARVATLSRVDIGSTVTGRVAQVRVNEGAEVREGDVLVQLEDSEWRAALAQAEAGEAQARTIGGPAQRWAAARRTRRSPRAEATWRAASSALSARTPAPRPRVFTAAPNSTKRAVRSMWRRRSSAARARRCRPMQTRAPISRRHRRSST
jgi:hypothetical protein